MGPMNIGIDLNSVERSLLYVRVVISKFLGGAVSNHATSIQSILEASLACNTSQQCLWITIEASPGTSQVDVSGLSPSNVLPIRMLAVWPIGWLSLPPLLCRGHSSTFVILRPPPLHQGRLLRCPTPSLQRSHFSTSLPHAAVARSSCGRGRGRAMTGIGSGPKAASMGARIA